jgi:hypothetical protein
MMITGLGLTEEMITRLGLTAERISDDRADLILTLLRAIRAKLDEHDHKFDEVITRLGAVERDIGQLHVHLATSKVDFAAIQVRLDNVGRRWPAGALLGAPTMSMYRLCKDCRWAALEEDESGMVYRCTHPCSMFLPSPDYVTGKPVKPRQLRCSEAWYFDDHYPAARKTAIAKLDKPTRGLSQWISVCGFAMLSVEADSR